MRGGINLFLLFFPFLSLSSPRSSSSFFFLSFVSFSSPSRELRASGKRTRFLYRPSDYVWLCNLQVIRGGLETIAIFHVSRRGEKRSRRGGEIRKNRCVLDLVRVNYVLTTAAFTILPWENNRPYVANLCGEHISYRTMSKVSVLNRGDCRFP